MVNDNYIKDLLYDDFDAVIRLLFEILNSDDTYDYGFTKEDVINILYSVIYDIKYHEVVVVLDDIRNTLNNYRNKDICDYVYYELLDLAKEVKKIKKNLERGNDSVILKTLIYDVRDLNVVKRFYEENKNSILKDSDNFDVVVKMIIDSYLEEGNNYYYQILRMLSCYIDKESVLNFLEDKAFSNNLLKVRGLFDERFLSCTRSMVKNYGIRTDFSISSIVSSENITPNHQGRLNFTSQKCLTIDGKDSLCLDDGIYLRENKNGTYTLFVFIADVPSLIEYDSLLFQESRINGETIYLPDTNICMYPDSITYGKASLIKGEKKNVIAHIVDVAPNYDIISSSYRICKAIIKVSDNLYYDKADRLFFSDDTEKRRMLQNLLAICSKGGGNIDSKVDDDIYISSILVEYLMLLVNSLSAEKFRSLSLPYLRRAFLYPKEEEILKHAERINSEFGLKPKDYNKVVNALKELNAKAFYTTLLYRHDALNKDDYSHSTSPLRRYGDSLNEYVLYDLYFKKASNRDIYKWEEILKKEAEFLNKRISSNQEFCYDYSCKKLIKERSD